MIISRVCKAPLLSGAEFAAAVTARFGQHVSVFGNEGEPPVEHGVDVRPPGEPGFAIAWLPRSGIISVDGTREQNAMVAAWVRSQLPADFPRVIAYDDDWSWHVDLVWGITSEQVLANTVSHSDPGWNAGDPDLR